MSRFGQLPRFIPVLLGALHLIVTVAEPGSSFIWDIFLYNALLTVAALWTFLKGERLIASAIFS